MSKTTHEKAETGFSDLVTHDGLFAVDSKQRIIYWSPSAQRTLGYRSEDVTGRFCYEVIGGRDSRNYRFCRKSCPVMMNARRGRPTPNYDIMCLVPTGEEKWLNMSVAIPTKTRREFQVFHIFRDVTRRRRVEEFAQRASTALRNLLQEDKADLKDEGASSSTPLPKLSRREMEVVRLLAAGMTTRQIAETLAIQPVTARNHITRLLNRLGVENRLQAVVYASERRLI